MKPVNMPGASKSKALLTALAALALAIGTLGAPSPSNCRKIKTTHVVKSGESVAKIADFYGVSQRDLRELNGLKKGKALKVGQKLKIPMFCEFRERSTKWLKVTPWRP